MTAQMSVFGTLLTVFTTAFLVFLGSCYLAGRIFGAGIRKTGQLWRSGQLEADRRYRETEREEEERWEELRGRLRSLPPREEHR